MEQKINLTIKPETAKGTYSNMLLITHTNSEFILDFAQSFPGMEQGEIAARIIITPEHAKNIANALADNIQKYENERINKTTFVLPAGAAKA